ncbi:hypothetical protein Peur_044763 [Populus x canadensis]
MVGASAEEFLLHGYHFYPYPWGCQEIVPNKIGSYHSYPAKQPVNLLHNKFLHYQCDCLVDKSGRFKFSFLGRLTSIRCSLISTL